MTPTSPISPAVARGAESTRTESQAKAERQKPNCCDCGAPNARVNDDAIFWMGRKAAEESARCDNCNESAYDREQEKLLETGVPDRHYPGKKYAGRP